MNEATLIVMAKRPELGKVKTRLAKTEGDLAALKLYEAMLTALASLINRWTGEVHVWWGGGLPQAPHNNYFTKATHSLVQPEGDLGHRMKSAFDFGLNRPDGGACIMIGADCPDLGIQHLLEAVHLLRDNEVVFGPANDGGYYLIAMRTMHDQLFSNMPWSTEDVLQKSIDRLEQTNTSLALLSETLHDIDDIADLRQSKWGRNKTAL